MTAPVVKSWKSDRYRYDWLKSLQRYAFPIIGNLPVGAIDTALVLRVLQQELPDDSEDAEPGDVMQYWIKHRTAAEMLRGRLETVFSWAKAQGFRSGDNPFAGRRNKLTPRQQRRRQRVMRHGR